MPSTTSNLSSAIEDFRRARSQADLYRVLALMRGESTELLSYDDVLDKLKIKGISERGLRDIPLDSIVGSVGRYTDFTRNFLPKGEVSEERWARVMMAVDDLAGVPPIEVYQIGEAYFVKDGNHRVSVARQLGATHIQAYVTEVRTRVPLTPDVQPDDLIIKAEYAGFLERTRLDELRPEANLSVTAPGKYQDLLEHIDVHRYYMGLDFKRDVPYEEAVTHWYDYVYTPVIEIIRDQGILQSFLDRTETDLYLWLAEHREAIEESLGWKVRTGDAAQDLVDQFRPKTNRFIMRVSEKIVDTITQQELSDGPPPGTWRKQRLAAQRVDRIFSEILVPVNGEATGWYALEQAIEVARREDAYLHGLHVVRSEASLTSPEAWAIKEEFERRCESARIQGTLVLVAGEVHDQICRRSRWTDLIITNLAYPPAPQPLARLSSGFRLLIQRCPRPLLAVPQRTTQLRSALLAYDGSLKAKEALFVATYVAGQWQIPLTVMSVVDTARTSNQTLKEAEAYIQAHGVTAEYILKSGDVAEAILSLAEDRNSELLIMGGYGANPVVEVVLGSVVNQVLRESHKPMLICR